MQPASSAQDASDTQIQSDRQVSPGSQGAASRLARLVLLAIGALLVGSLLLPAITKGLWDPYELETADLARRAAIHLYGADELARQGADNRVPTLEEVGRGELPLLSLALSLKLFGTGSWPLRLPLVAWGLLGAGALYTVCSRLAGSRLAGLSVAVLLTSPLYFVQARTALGEIVTMASLTLAFGSLMLAVFDPRLHSGARLGLTGLGALACFAGLHCRGALIGIALPSLSVGLTWALLSEQRREGEKSGEPVLSRLLGAGCLALGLAATAWGAWAAFTATEGSYLVALGSKLIKLDQFPTHDFVILQLGHGLLPWSALAPLALGMALHSASRGSNGANALRLAFALATVLGIGIAALLAPTIGNVPFAGVFAIAGVVAFALQDLDRRSAAVVPLAMTTAALLVLFRTDFDNFPEKAFSAFAVASSKVPETFVPIAKKYLLVVTGISALACVLVVLDRALRSGDVLRDGIRNSGDKLWGRVVGAALSACLAFGRVLRLDLVLSHPGRVLAAGLVASALVLSFGFYPALGAQVSPLGAFDSYYRFAESDEPLGVMGERSGAMFLAGEATKTFTASQDALDWLMEKPEERRWLVAKLDELQALNSRYRKRPGTTGNLPVLDARSSRSLLLSNQLKDGEKNHNPFNAWLLDERPDLAHPLVVTLDDRLKVFGWEIRRKRDKEVVDKLEAGEHYQFVIGYEVKGRMSGSWQTFIHIDGEGQRFNGDHETLDGTYPYRYWRPGDVLLDVYDFELESKYKPGRYQVFFGLFTGDDRMRVSVGPNDDNRIKAGFVDVVEL